MRIPSGTHEDPQCYQIVVNKHAQAGARGLRILSVGGKRKWSGLSWGADTDKLCDGEAVN